MHPALLPLFLPSVRVFRRRHPLRRPLCRVNRLRRLALPCFLSFFASLSVTSAAELTVRWDDNSTSELGFRVERSSDGSTFAAVATVGANTTAYTDTSLVSGTTYWYRVRAYNSNSTSAYSNVTSGTAYSTTTSPSTTVPGRFQAFMFRAVSGKTALAPLVQTFTVSAANKNILLRGVGTTLSLFTASPTLSDPILNLYCGTTLLASNNDWLGPIALISLFTQVGAYALPGYSSDAVVYKNLPVQTYNFSVTGENSGLAQSELYDADLTEVPAGRVTKALARGAVGTGSSVLIGGFVIAGDAPMKLLIRAVGPGLGAVTNALRDPILSVYKGSTLVAKNDNWGGSSTLASAFSAVGASPLSSTSSDSALIATLSPGFYSSIVVGASNTTGIARLEFYELR